MNNDSDKRFEQLDELLDTFIYEDFCFPYGDINKNIVYLENEMLAYLLIKEVLVFKYDKIYFNLDDMSDIYISKKDLPSLFKAYLNNGNFGIAQWWYEKTVIKDA